MIHVFFFYFSTNDYPPCAKFHCDTSTNNEDTQEGSFPLPPPPPPDLYMHMSKEARGKFIGSLQGVNV